MRKWMNLTICFFMIFLIFIGCGGVVPNLTSNSKSASASVKNKSVTSSKDSNAIDVDLTVMSSTVVFSEVYLMMVSPNDYINQTVKVKGTFFVYQDKTTNKNYYSVIVKDATACCKQGLEFVLDGTHEYPKDYPSVGSEITIIGKFEVYTEDGNQYSHLISAKIVP